MNFIGSFDDYAINAVFFENYWNSGSVKLQERYFDNIVISTQPIGPVEDAPVTTGRHQKTNTHHVTCRFLQNKQMRFKADRPISHITLYASSGKMVTETSPSDSYIGHVDFADAPPGMYLYQVIFSIYLRFYHILLEYLNRLSLSMFQTSG